MKVSLITKTYPEEGDFQHNYSPLHNFVNESGKLGNFVVDRNKLPVNVDNPISIECQPSYDGTVNLIISDDDNPIRLINSRFTKTENNRFKIINRDQVEQTNIYKESNLSTTNLVLTPTKLPKIKFKQTRNCGSLAGGNYTFYMKYVDGDGNESDFVADTFQIPIFKGTVGFPKTISGTLVDEITDKAVVLYFTDLDTSFHGIKLYFSRETSDLNGYRISKYGEIMETFQITDDSMEVLITGNEEVHEVGWDAINFERFNFTSAKTQCQQQNMLFLGNISKTPYDVNTLRNLSLYFNVKCVQDDNVGWIDPKDYSTSDSGEYYDPENVCYRTGYWPDEYYRLGVVYVLDDGSHTDVFNLRGCCFNQIGDSNLLTNDRYIIGGIKQNLPDREFLDKSEKFQNTYGVFRNPSFDNVKIIDYVKKEVKPIHYVISLNDTDVIDELKKCGVKYCFFVRQKRIPTILFQGLSLAVDKTSGSPMIKDNIGYYTESFLTNSPSPINRTLGNIVTSEANLSASKAYSHTETFSGTALISPDASFLPSLQNTLCGTVMQLEKLSESVLPIVNKRNHIFYPKDKQTAKIYNFPTVFVNEDVPYKIVNDFQFSSRFGSAESAKDNRFFGKELKASTSESGEDGTGAYDVENRAILRGIYTSYVGVCGQLEHQCLYNVRLGNYSSSYTELYMKDRGSDHAPFYSISNNYTLELKPDETFEHSIWGGDCYSNTVTIRLNRNFTDPDAPINDYILEPDSWNEIYNGYMFMKESKNAEEHAAFKKENNTESSKGDWYKINRGDLNSAPLGMWITFKLLSSYNLGMRSEDRNNVHEMALMGNARSFYPISSMSTASNAKISESKLLNTGYSATVGSKEYYEHPPVPYVKTLFDNRIVFSNIQVEDDFKNGYRVFSPLAYQDIDRQYGAIVKLLPWGTNLVCVFEHGIGLIPVNEKALMQTTSGQSIHLFGAGVLQSQVSLISGDFGSIWQDSIIKTNVGIYGIDTYAKKIWRYSDQNGFETISDMKVQRFLNDNILLSESDKYPELALKNVRTHYNAYKGDVMFTFYNYKEGKEWNLCFNERLGKWITRYSWIPINSANINNCYFSLDKKRAELLGHIHSLKSSPFKIDSEGGYFWSSPNLSQITMDIVLNDDSDGMLLNVLSAETSYLDKNSKEITFPISYYVLNTFCKYTSITDKSGKITVNEEAYNNWWESNFPHWVETGEHIVPNDDGEFDDKYENFDSSEDENKDYEVPPMPLYLKLNVEVITTKHGVSSKPVYKTIVILPKEEWFKENAQLGNRKEEYDELLLNGFYVHGRAGIFDEMDYTDLELDNQILPTKWYDKQEPFEFEFVVNSPVGLHKIFDNLVIISNNVCPESIEYTIEGDTYSLFKNNDLFNNNIKKQLYKSGVGFKNAKLNYDTVLNQYSLTIQQDCKNMADAKFGRRLGNIQYKEDSWYATIEPLVFDPLLKASPDDQKAKWSSTRIRDKFLKVRVKYTGEDLVIITAIKNLCTLSRA